VWEDDGEIVSHYAGLPVPAIVAGEDTVAAVGVDAATAPSHRGRGLFESLARAVYEDCGSHGMAVTLCFPNDNSLRGFVKAGGHPVGRLETWVLPLDDAWVAARFHVPRVAARAARAIVFRGRRRAVTASVQETDQPPDDLDDLWADVRHHVAYGIARHGAWWRWRYAQRPGGDYRYFAVRAGGRLRGAAAVVVRDAFGGRFACVLELVAVDGDAAAALTRTIADAVTADAVGLACVALPATETAQLARAAGFRRLPRRLEPKPLHFGVADNCGDRPNLALGPWSLAWGDLDHL
jgi:hypothetical protein